MCIIVLPKAGQNVLISMLKSVIGTLDFHVKYLLQRETYPMISSIILSVAQSASYHT
ncbi:hypothetical protein MKX03_000799 [Papaver bracteatum]|nr:hypothetical protein MKX03_000799 [Papaver bracteatum]